MKISILILVTLFCAVAWAAEPSREFEEHAKENEETEIEQPEDKEIDEEDDETDVAEKEDDEEEPQDLETSDKAAYYRRRRSVSKI
ncbi:hypothetical protein TrispH2_010970 [Trichoplax sp. H2]|nr:hypothetical protein TrispH2_010970 [Trichoplax sp. H2]|eukprot:RDD37028.1 hypothetical protein TrispH2_010970 [Trichoplax sp. H2]